MPALFDMLLPYIIKMLPIPLGDFIDSWKGNEELHSLISSALLNAEMRAKKEVNDKELIEWATGLPLLYMPTIKITDAISQFAKRPYDNELAQVIYEEMVQNWRNIPHEKLTAFSLLYVKFLKEELAIAIPEFREKIQTLANLKVIDGYNIIRREEVIMGDKFEISGTVGILNTGEIKNVKSIDVNISAMNDSGNSEIAKAIKEVTEAIVQNNEITQQQREEVLELMQEISTQATLAPEKRSSKGVIKSILMTVTTTIGAISGLAQIWSTWGDKILKFFGL